MNISRYLDEDLIVLDLEVDLEPPPEEGNSNRWKERNKERILEGLVSLLDQSGKTGNKSKLLIDFINRERKATTAIGDGIAFPHVRTMQAKELIIAFARSPKGYEFDAPDGQPINIFIIMAAPPYDDNLYLKVFKALAENLQYDSFRQELMNAEEPFEIIRAFRNMEC